MRDHVTQKIVAYVEKHWREGITVKEVAKEFALDPSDANRLFRSVTGKTMARYVREKRKEYLLTRLRTDHCFAYELARELGYQEEHSFTRWVKKAFGMSWTELCRLQRHGSLHPSRPDGTPLRWLWIMPQLVLETWTKKSRFKFLLPEFDSTREIIFTISRVQFPRIDSR
jgi:AraC-like DNA-binding protein